MYSLIPLSLLAASALASPLSMGRLVARNDDRLLPNPKGIVNPPAKYIYQSESDFEFFVSSPAIYTAICIG